MKCFEEPFSDESYQMAIRRIHESIKIGVLEAFRKRDETAREKAASAIAELEKFGTLMDLFTALEHPDPIRKELAIRILKNLQDDVILPLLELVLIDDEVKASITETFSPYLGDALDPFIKAFCEGNGIEEATINLFVQGILHGTVESKIYAAQTLAQIGEPTVHHLIEVLKHGDSDTKYLAAGTLMIIGKPAIQPLIHVLGARDEETREIAARTLAEMGTDVISPLLQSPWREDELVRFYATIVLAQVGKPAIPHLLEEVRRGNADGEKFVGSVLLTMGEKAVDPLLFALSEDDAAIKDLAGNVLIQMGDSAVQHLADQFRAASGNEDLQIFISMLLVEIGDFAVTPLIEILKSGTTDEKIIAMYALTQVGPGVIESIDALRHEGNPELDGYIAFILNQIQEDHGSGSDAPD